MASRPDDLVLAACKTLGLQARRQSKLTLALCGCNDCRSIDARAVAVPVLPNWSFAAFVCMNKPYSVCSVQQQCSIGQ